MPKKTPKFNLNSAIKSALRRIFSRSKFTKEVVTPVLDKVKEIRLQPTKKGGTKKRVFFECCKCLKKYPRSNIYVDHIEPVVGPEGFQDWNLYIQRMFTDSSNLQVLCGKCHDEKTAIERTTRNKIKKESKPPKEITTTKKRKK